MSFLLRHRLRRAEDRIRQLEFAQNWFIGVRDQADRHRENANRLYAENVQLKRELAAANEMLKAIAFSEESNPSAAELRTLAFIAWKATNRKAAP